MSGAPKLSFRQNPLRLPVKKNKPQFTFNLDMEAQKAPAPKPSKPAEPPPSPSAVPTRRITIKIILFGFLLILVVRMLQFLWSEEAMHTIYKLSCTKKNRVLTCDSAVHSGTFIVEIPPKCSKSVYEIGGLPFSVSKRGNIFKANAKDLTVKNIDGDCTIKAFVDSHEFKAEVPFTWISTKKHTWFSIRINGHIVVERADASLFESVENGIWVAYTYDLNVKNKHVEVFGDAGDIIFVYGVLP
jgi:hypothetical protein